ncbi:MAG: hypothetical protein IJI14_17845 [Anaerolineaceae bacterium]|nr:hypothetical protein [Anaerolineaceae bacterium]
MSKKNERYAHLSLPDLYSIVLLKKLSFREAEILFGEPGDVTYSEFINLFEKLLFELDEREHARDLVKKYKVFEAGIKDQ